MSNKKKIIIGVCVLAILAITLIGGYVFAKYQSQVTGKGIADVAKWSFNVNGNASSMQTIALAETYNKETLVNNKIAPGTTGDFSIIVDATDSEVGVDYNVTFENEKQKPTNLKFIYENVEYSSIQELEDVLQGTINANDENKEKTLHITWKWEYETGDTKEEISNNDKIDTQEGIQDLNYTFDVVVTGTQVTPQK